MTPDLAQRFNILTTYAVSKDDYMFAYGFPCLVLSITYVANERLGTIHIMCRDIFNGVVHCVQLHQTAPIVTFTPERCVHVVIMVDSEGILTDTEDAEFSNKRLNVDIGDRISTLSAPVRLYHDGKRQWVTNRIIEKIMPGEPSSLFDGAC